MHYKTRFNLIALLYIKYHKLAQDFFFKKLKFYLARIKLFKSDSQDIYNVIITNFISNKCRSFELSIHQRMVISEISALPSKE